MKELRGYYRQVKGWLPCGGKTKKKMMASITATIDNYIEENPGIDFAAVQNHFGTPQQIAAAFVDEMGTEELLNKLRVRKKLVTVVTAVAIAVILLWAGVVTIALLDYLNQMHGYGVVTIY